MSYAEGTPERALQDALTALDTAVESVARLSGAVKDGYYIQDWAIIGGASNPDGGGSTSTMFVVPGTSMTTYQLHGLLDLTDMWVVTGGSDDDEGQSDDD